ncbi:MAG: BamA/TamA family outer membrane protein [Bacteroidales bacterium]|jgi:outer membrane protein assembly factor BamA|nr:BamA/TamA family outer membrane protein [Bacteroidales bacterium]
MKKNIVILFFYNMLFALPVVFSQNSNDSLAGNTSHDTTQSSFFNNALERTLSIFEWQRGGTTITTYPSFGYDPASAFTLGIMQTISFPHKDTSQYKRKTTLINYISYSTNNWINVRSTLGLYTRGGWAINTRVQFQQSPDKYYGIGQNFRNTNPQTYEIKHLQVYGNCSHSLFFNEFFAGLTYDISYANIYNVNTNDNVLPENMLPKQKNNLLLGFGPYLAYDSRNDMNFPTRGNYLTAGLFLYPKYNNNSYGFYNYMSDLRTYIPIFEKQVLAVQFFSGCSQGDMPFYKLYQLGGTERMRGISNKYMYIDKYVYFTQAELRRHLWGRVSVVVFGGIGNTYSNLRNTPDAVIKYVYGIGGRLQASKNEKINLRIDYGRARFNDSGLYLTVSEAF